MAFTDDYAPVEELTRRMLNGGRRAAIAPTAHRQLGDARNLVNRRDDWTPPIIVKSMYYDADQLSDPVRIHTQFPAPRVRREALPKVGDRVIWRQTRTSRS